MFWSELTGEDVLTPVSTSAARWFSWLRPLEKIHASFTALLAHLLYEFTHHANKEQKETIQWMFLFFCSWEFRLTIAGIIDVLRICFRSKNLLEKAKSLTAVCKLAGQLKEELDRYCRRNSLLADAMAGERALPAGGTLAESVCDLYRQQKDQHPRLTYMPLLAVRSLITIDPDRHRRSSPHEEDLSKGESLQRVLPGTSPAQVRSQGGLEARSHF